MYKIAHEIIIRFTSIFSLCANIIYFVAPLWWYTEDIRVGQKYSGCFYHFICSSGSCRVDWVNDLDRVFIALIAINAIIEAYRVIAICATRRMDINLVFINMFVKMMIVSKCIVDLITKDESGSYKYLFLGFYCHVADMVMSIIMVVYNTIINEIDFREKINAKKSKTD